MDSQQGQEQDFPFEVEILNSEDNEEVKGYLLGKYQTIIK